MDMKSLSSDATGRFNQFFNDLRDGLLVPFVAHVRRLDPAGGARVIEAGLGWARKAAFARLALRRQAVEMSHY
ncbi:MAG: hypothetical protein HYZ40_14550 [Rhodospirillales bacterium]|nr:hypothetical protein [Rhodospirillales bacterium]